MMKWSKENKVGNTSSEITKNVKNSCKEYHTTAENMEVAAKLKKLKGLLP